MITTEELLNPEKKGWLLNKIAVYNNLIETIIATSVVKRTYSDFHNCILKKAVLNKSLDEIIIDTADATEKVAFFHNQIVNDLCVEYDKEFIRLNLRLGHSNIFQSNDAVLILLIAMRMYKQFLYKHNDDIIREFTGVKIHPVRMYLDLLFFRYCYQQTIDEKTWFRKRSTMDGFCALGYELDKYYYFSHKLILSAITKFHKENKSVIDCIFYTVKRSDYLFKRNRYKPRVRLLNRMIKSQKNVAPWLPQIS
jgi:hypothetical protein